MLDEIVSVFGGENFVKSVNASGCKADLTNIDKTRKVLRVDGYTRGTKFKSMSQCDFAVFLCPSATNNVVCVLVELKRGNLDAHQVFKQLQGTAEMIEDLLGRFSLSFIPVAITGHSRIDQENKLKNRKMSIRFRNIGYRIRYQRCNTPNNLFNAINSTLAG